MLWQLKKLKNLNRGPRIMLNNIPQGDIWRIKDNDPNSQHFGKTYPFDFSYIMQDELKQVFKKYIWDNYRTQNRALSSLYLRNLQYKYFVRFAEQRNISSLGKLTPAYVHDYLSFLATMISDTSGQPLKYESQKKNFDCLKAVVAWCSLHSPDELPSENLFLGNEYRRVNHRMRIDFIPDEIVAHINNGLVSEDNIYVKFGIIILESTGIRIGDLLALKTDCISPHPINGYMISWYDHKNRKQRPTNPVTTECAIAFNRLLS